MILGCKNCVNYTVCRRYEKLFHKIITRKKHPEKTCADFRHKNATVCPPTVGVAEIERTRTPCASCVYSPPSSFFGKPCSYCPAEAKRSDAK